MKVLGFNFTKIGAEKLSGDFTGLKVQTNLDIPEIKPVKSDFLDQKEKILGIKFINNINYNPNLAKISLEGNILLSVEEGIFDSVLKNWEKKEIPEEFRLKIFNLILRKATLKALQLEDELNLPLHMPMPSLKSTEKKE